MNRVHLVTSNRCVASSCPDTSQVLLGRIQTVKQELLLELNPSFGRPDRMLQLALNEAEGLAWQTAFPLLVFPALAREKAEAVNAWKVRQQRLHGNIHLSFAA